MQRPRKLSRLTDWTTIELQNWYNANMWADRVSAYDAHTDELKLAERDSVLAQTTREIAFEHMSMLQDARELASREVSKLLKASQESEMHGLLKPAEMIKMIDAVVKLDRLVRDQPTENTVIKEDLSGLDLDDLKKLRELRQKLDK